MKFDASLLPDEANTTSIILDKYREVMSRVYPITNAYHLAGVPYSLDFSTVVNNPDGGATITATVTAKNEDD